MAETQLDDLDRAAALGFDGYIVRKDLVRRFARQYPVPTYVCEFLLGRYCASTNEDEIQEGLQIVERQLRDRAIRSGEEELFKARARETGTVKIIDIISARLDTKTNSFLATLPSLQLKDVSIEDRLVHDNERMLTGGFYAEIDLTYDAMVAEEKSGRPFSVSALRPIQLSKRDVLDALHQGRKQFTAAQWKQFLLRSVGLEPTGMTERNRDAMLLRMVPFVENNYNLVELGPRGTGKSHLYQQISPYAHLVSGGKATVARMFVNNANGQRGLVCLYDVVCFDEVSGVSFDQKDGVNIMKGYMESGEFSRGKESIRAYGSIVMVGNFDVDVQHQQRVGHLFGPMPPEMRNDTALMDRIHCYLPGWDVPKINEAIKTNHFGLVSDFISECWTRLRSHNRVSVLQGRLTLGGALSGRDQNAVLKTISGLLKLVHPATDDPVSDEDLEWAVRLALECRRRVKEQQKRIGSAEFRNTQFSFTLGQSGVEKFVVTPELQSEDQIARDPLPPGQVWSISPGDQDEGSGLYRIEVNEDSGSGVKILNRPAPQAFSESVKYAEANLYARASELVGDRNPREHQFSIQLRAFDASKGGRSLGVATLLALCSSLINKSLRGGLVVVGGINLGGSLDPLHNAIDVVELAVEKGASVVLMPVSSRKQLFEISDDLATKVTIVFYNDAREALIKAIAD
jgi:ATP-dependent Lon protease